MKLQAPDIVFSYVYLTLWENINTDAPKKCQQWQMSVCKQNKWKNLHDQVISYYQQISKINTKIIIIKIIPYQTAKKNY